MKAPYYFAIVAFVFSHHALSYSQPSDLKVKGPSSQKLEFELPNAANTVKGLEKPVKASDFNNVKGFIFYFSSADCEESLSQEESLIEVHRKLAPCGYPVIVFNNIDSKSPKYESIKNRAKDLSYPFAYLLDPEKSVANSLNIFHAGNIAIVEFTKSDDINIILKCALSSILPDMTSIIKQATSGKIPENINTDISCEL